MSNTDDIDQQEDTFLTNIIKAFIIILLTIGLIYIRNMLAKSDVLTRNPLLQWSIFSFIVIIFMFIMSSVQGSSFISLLTVIILIASITVIIWYAAGTAKG